MRKDSGTRRLDRLARGGAAAITIGSLGMLAAFALGVPLISRLIHPWSCLAFLAAGSVLLGEQIYPAKYSIPFRLLGGAVFVIGSIIWAEYALNVNPGFDRLLFPGRLWTSVTFPGRPAPLTAFAIQLIGLMLVLLSSRRTVAVLIREACALTVITLCYFAFIGYPLRTGVTAEFALPMATALAMVSAACVLLAGAEGRLIPLLADPGPAGSFARRLMPVPFVLPVLTTAVRLGLRNFGISHSPAGNFLLSSLDILATVGIIWFSSSQVLRVDRLRRQAENALRSSKDALDGQIQVRTQELVDTADQLAIEASRRQGVQNDLQQANAMLNSVIEASPLAICAFYPDGSVRKSNVAAHDLLLPAAPDCLAIVEKAARGESIAGQELVRVSSGRELYLNVWASPIMAADNTVAGVVVVAANVSQRKALELQIQQSQKLESLGVLAGGIAHDFNNLLTGIIGNASLLEEKFEPQAPEAEIARSLFLAGDRMAKLTAQLLAYSGRARVVIQPLDLSKQVSQMGSLMMASAPPNTQLRLALAEALPPINADAGQLKQVVMSLVANAAEAIGTSPGTIEVITEIRYVSHPELAASVTQQPMVEGNYVALTVRDSGGGMSPETQARIFDPFFTTKFTGRGLGLSAVLGIVRAHGGALTVTSQSGVGTTFRVFFPIVERPVANPGKRPQGNAECATILVVDDEEVVRNMARAALEQAGYVVLTAGTGQEALSVCEKQQGRIDAVLLDTNMPVMSGCETMARLQARWPELVIIASSGYGEEEAQLQFGHRAAAFIQKPYTIQQLAAKISGVLQNEENTSSSRACL